MKVTIHQPEHMPWLGFFHKMGQADLYVVLDSVQFTKNNWQNRNKFVDRSGNAYWQTVPVVMKGHTDSRISEMEIDRRQAWARKYWGRFKENYGKHPYFPLYGPKIEEILFSDVTLLVDLNLRLIELLREAFGIRVPIVRSSALPVSGARSELLLALCKHLKADCYLSGPSGRDYLDLALFRERGVEVEFHEFRHPEYKAPMFQPFLSAMDLLLNCGPESAAVIQPGGGRRHAGI